MKRPRPRVTCKVCGKRVAVHADHTLWPHSVTRRVNGGSITFGRCPASEHHPDWMPDGSDDALLAEVWS